MHAYIEEVLVPHVMSLEGFKFVPKSGVSDAIQDGVVVLETSFDIRIAEYHPNGLPEMLVPLQALVKQCQGEIDLRPELGFAREHANSSKLMKWAHEATELGVFQSIDLYSHEGACPPEAVQSLYKKRALGG